MRPDDASPSQIEALTQADRQALGMPSLLVALEFLTIVRLRRPPIVAGSALARAQLWYPLVGLLIGLAVAGIDRLLSGQLPAAPEAVLLLIALEGIPGLLHLDGLADSADGLLCLHSGEKRLEIMRDSRTGAFGAAVVALYLLLAYTAIAALTRPARSAVLILAPAIGRGSMVLVMAAIRNARPGGLATGFHREARSWVGAAAMLSAVAMAGIVLGAGGLILLLTGAVAALAVAWFALARIGGVTGDIIGASCELAQVASLTLATALQAHAWFRPWL